MSSENEKKEKHLRKILLAENKLKKIVFMFIVEKITFRKKTV